MRLTRKQSIIASVGILILFFAGVALLRPGSPSLPSTTDGFPDSGATSSIASDPAIDTASGPEFVLDDFRREELKDGKKVWEVKASRGRYSPGGGKASLENSTMWLYKKDGGIVSLKSDMATLKLDGPEGLSAAEFSGNIVIVDGTTQLECQQAIYDKAKDLIIAPDLVKITGDKMALEGIGMEVKVSSKEIKLLKQTKTSLEPKDSAPIQE